MPSRDECIRAVGTFKSDVFAAKPDERSRSKKLGLKPIIEMLANKKDEHNNVAAVVRKKSRFRTINDLKDAKTCFSGYRRVGWNAIYLALKNNSDRQRLNNLQSISTFFKESCILNVDAKNQSFPSNLYSLCKKDESNLTLEEKTFKCLEDGADVAFVNVSAVRAYASRNVVFNFKYKLLCPKNEANEQSLCFLAKVTLGSILVHENKTKVKEDDIFLTFLGLNRYLGRTFDREIPMFEMYGPYEDKSNVLFPDATMKLQRASPEVQYVSCEEPSMNHVLPKVRHTQKIFKIAAKRRSKQLSHFIFTVFDVLCVQCLYARFF